MIIPDNVGSKYRYIILAGQRVAQLQRGARPRLEKTDSLKLTDIALKELDTDLLEFHKVGEKPSESASDEASASSATAKKASKSKKIEEAKSAKEEAATES